MALRRVIANSRLRATQVYALYHYVALDRSIKPLSKEKSVQREVFKNNAQRALDEAMLIAEDRSHSYRVSKNRIASWKVGPTAYPYGYLWTVSNLYYWWRDEAKALIVPRSPCFLNILDPLDVAFGWDEHPIPSTLNCLTKPAAEPSFPLSGLRE